MMNDDDKLVAAHRADVFEAPAHLKQQWRNAIDDAAAMERGRQKSPDAAWHPGSVSGIKLRILLRVWSK